MRATDITGQKFNMLTAVCYVESRILGNHRRTFWLYRCDCGKERVAAKSDVTCGKIVSCGCSKRERERQDVANEQRRQAMEEWKADQLANRSVVPPSMRSLPGRIIQARHVEDHSVGVPLTGKGMSSLMIES